MPQVKEELPEHELLVFTGPIDAYFASQVGQTQSNVGKCSTPQGLPKLEYRSIFWEKEYMEPQA